MHSVLQFGAKVLVVMFLIGIVGSLIVIVITFVQDLDLLFEDEELASQPDNR
jgi:hypothetical protein